MSEPLRELANRIIYERRHILLDGKVKGHKCRNCGEIHEWPAYVFAQNTMGHDVNHTCECGHVIAISNSEAYELEELDEY
jgi:RNase P subunit RPR2